MTGKCFGNENEPSCEQKPVWRRSTSAGDHYFCDQHAREEVNFNEVNTYLWTRLDEAFTEQRLDAAAQGFVHVVDLEKTLSRRVMLDEAGAHAIVGARRSPPSVDELRAMVKPIDLRPSVAGFIHAAREAGHDAFGVANDPEAIEAIDAAKRPNKATIVEGDIVKDSIDPSKNIEYSVSLVRNGPGDVEFLLVIDGRICGKLPFDNLIKAQVRLDPNHVSGPEKQIQKLRKETAEARAQMYDWQARALLAEERVAKYEAADGEYWREKSSKCICGDAMRAIGEHRDDCPERKVNAAE